MNTVNNNENNKGLHLYKTDKEKGLSSDEVSLNQTRFGKNKIKEKKRESGFVKFLKQFLDPMIFLLIIAGVITLVLVIAYPPEETIELAVQYAEFGVIMFILFSNTIFGAVQECKAEKEAEALMKLASPKARVIRDGQTIIIDSEDVTIGDIIVIEAGDIIPADALLFNSSNLEINESIITGESTNVIKDHTKEVDLNLPLGDQIQRVFSGSLVVNGTGRAIVTAIGNETQVGLIQKSINDVKNEKTPLQKKIGKLSKIIGAFAAMLCIAVFFIYIFLIGNGDWGQAWHPALIIAISLSIAAIPEGLVAVISIILSYGAKKLAKHHALIKHLPAVETLGGANVICSDKTGTLTQNKMTVVSVYQNGMLTDLTDTRAIKLLTYGSIDTNVGININLDNNLVFVGDPTETSIVEALFKNNIDKRDLDIEYQRLLELPFDSERKLMSVVVKKNDQYLMITKGAIDSLEQRVISGFNNDVIEANHTYSNQAYRVLGVAYKNLTKDEINNLSTIKEDSLSFLGLIAIIDPLREEAVEAVRVAMEAGIKPVMITGDHLNTAVAIGRQLNILESKDEAITGVELNKLSDEELNEKIEHLAVYARVSPFDKIRIVKAWQNKNKIVSMTGDGVNDAPALKQADLGCAMGITGTDVSKNAADLILTNDNFATIVHAVDIGRKVMDSIKRVICLLLTTNFAGLISLFFGILILGINPHQSLQILWINVISETLPGIALGLNFNSSNLMSNKPLPKNAHIVDWRMWLKILLLGFFIGMTSILLFYLGSSAQLAFDFHKMRELFNSLPLLKEAYKLTPTIHLKEQIELIEQYAREGSTLSFMFMGLSLSFNAISLRTNHSIIYDKIKESRFVYISFIVSLLLIAFVTYTPVVNSIFNMSPYTMKEYNWLNVLPYIFFIIPVFFFEFLKLNKYLKQRKTFTYNGWTYLQYQTEIKKIKKMKRNQRDISQHDFLNSLLLNNKLKLKLLKEHLVLNIK
ncbi:cation-translocating P-type ATPase [Ureaplasma canigenitalium]|uniref:cation-translocating P-type ATPase n=1 Tax=Ureaplasma canigenitalium TaxID=42092 RepID=UPI000B075CAB|nr:cation-translocating P-type ATPase [Ureaplasma canigenitalium]